MIMHSIWNFSFDFGLRMWGRGILSKERLSNHGQFRRTRWQIQYRAAAADEGLLWIILMMKTTPGVNN